jgi:hypothetical protein
MKRLAAAITALAALVACAPASAQQPVDSGSGPLVYVFVLDGLEGDHVDQGKAPYLASLLAGQEEARATLFKESRSIMVAETNPNHTAMATGDYADRSGIAGNTFAVYGPPGAGEDECPQGPPDETQPPHVTSGESAGCILSETLFQAAARQPSPAAVTTAGIFGKPKLGRLFSAPGADYLWAPCEQSSGDPDYCSDVPINPATRYALDDSIVMDEVLRSVREGVPADGAVKRPNLTLVNFPQIDSAGHATGTGPVYDTAIGMADEQLRRFVDAQKEQGLWSRTVMIVLSDHGMDTTGAKTTLQQRFEAAGIDDGSYEIVQNGSVDMVYLTDRTDPGRFELLKQLRAAAMSSILAPAGSPGVDEALYREPNPADGGADLTLAAVHPGWHNDGPRTGDLFVTHQEGGAFSEPANPLTGNHGGPLTADNFLAVVGGSELIRNRGGLAGEVGPRFDDTLLNPHQSENVDVAPTALGLLGREPPAQSRGRFLEEAFVLSRLPGGGAGLPGVDPAGTAGKRRIRLSVTPRRARVGRRLTFRFRAMVPRDPAVVEPVACRRRAGHGARVRGAGACAAAKASAAQAQGRLVPAVGARVRFAGRSARAGRRGYARVRVVLRRAKRHRAVATRSGLLRGTTRVRAVRAPRKPRANFTG